MSKKTIFTTVLCLGAWVSLWACTKSEAPEGGTDGGTESTTAAPNTTRTASNQQPGRTGAPRQIPVEQIESPLTASAGPDVQPTSAVAYVIAEPAKLELGKIATEDSATAKVKLTNTGSSPRTIIDCKGQCSCTSIDCPRQRVLQPGESIDVTVKLDGGARPQILHKTMRFIIEAQDPIVIPIEAEAVSYVTMEPARIDAAENPDGVFTLRAVDGKPFKVTGLHPPVIDDLPEVAAVEHQLAINWDKWRETGARPKLLIYLDHPKCMRVYADAFDPAYNIPVKEDFGPEIDTEESVREVTPRELISRQMAALIARGNTQPIVDAVEAGEIEVDLRDGQDNTILAVATKHGDTELMQFLLDHGADYQAIGQLQRTPLMFASESKNAAAVQMLLDAGADMSAVDQLGGTALWWAAGMGTAQCVGLLIEAGAEVNAPGLMGTPLAAAAGFGEAESVRLLVAAGADLNAPDSLESATPLMQAVKTSNLESARMIIEAGADLEARDKKGRTAILNAGSYGGATVEVMRMLLDAGADPSVVDNANHSLWDLVNKRGDPRAAPVIELLKERGLAPSGG